MRTSLRRSLATAATVTLLTALTACGGDDGGEAADEPTTAASEDGTSDPGAEETEAEESDDDGATAAEGEDVDPDEFLETFRNGVENSTTAHMTMTTGLSGMSIDAEGDVDYQTDPPSMAITMTIPNMGGTMDIRLVEGIFYMNLGQQSQNKFIKADPEDPNNPLGDIGELTDTMDPVRSFEQFAAGLQKVVYVGEEDLGGDSADHYVLTLDTAKVEPLKEAGAAGIPKELDYDIWLDDEDRMRQVKIDMGGSGQVEINVDEWGDEVDIEAPPANQIAEMPQG